VIDKIKKNIYTFTMLIKWFIKMYFEKKDSPLAVGTNLSYTCLTNKMFSSAEGDKRPTGGQDVAVLS
jgi:hypothetical protein